ncbi:hypothetical protein [Fulvivirga sediminis]|uniref:SMODS and SLOG-associating 2TM effector domain-containing protein n=1 Tax=Fulvivirga sediminis TaxID=2803949 RepID=A0A937F5L4_9BACT|nr:hypothetical protein [Fulvivirga sediminis]MBL3655079.1 hypothetical protein [Fulvivirga sediminis]
MTIDPKGDNELKEMIIDSVKHIEDMTLLDGKILDEMNNALSWILTLTTVIFVYYSEFFRDHLSCYELAITDLSKILFIFSLVLFLTHKIALIEYDKIKGRYLGDLRIYSLDLKYDTRKLRDKLPLAKEEFKTFMLKLRSAHRRPSSESSETVKTFDKYESKLEILGKIITISFWIEIGAFIIFVAGAAILMF